MLQGVLWNYICKKTNTQDSYTNIVDAKGTGIITGTQVMDTDPTEVLVETDPAIEVVKEDANIDDIDGTQFNDTQTVLEGEQAVFHITVKNTGTNINALA